jgi:hypothetical protein
MLLDRATHPSVKDTLWATIVRLSQEAGGDWQLAAIWMMLPGLRKAVWRWHPYSRSDVQELQAEAVAGFLEELRKPTRDPRDWALSSGGPLTATCGEWSTVNIGRYRSPTWN